MENQYYIQKGSFGNCVLWWRNNDYGYTLNLDEAKKFSEEKAKEVCASIGKNYKMWPVEFIDARSSRHVEEINLSEAPQECSHDWQVYSCPQPSPVKGEFLMCIKCGAVKGKD